MLELLDVVLQVESLKIGQNITIQNVNSFISDPPKGYNDDLSNIDIAFLQIHVPTEENGTQDLTLMKELIKKLPDVLVFVRQQFYLDK